MQKYLNNYNNMSYIYTNNTLNKYTLAIQNAFNLQVNNVYNTHRNFLLMEYSFKKTTIITIYYFQYKI